MNRIKYVKYVCVVMKDSFTDGHLLIILSPVSMLTNGCDHIHIMENKHNISASERWL